MDLDNLIKGLYENFTLGRLPERQFNRLMTEYDTEQSNLEQRISELETATERISTKAVQIDKFVRLVKKYRDFEELTTPMLNDFIEKVVIHEAEGGRTKDRTQQVDIYFNFIGNFVLPLSEDEYKAILEKGRQNNRKRAEKMRELRMSDPEYAKYLEERNAEYNRRHTARRKEQMEALRARAEAGDQEAQSQLAERKQYQVRATVKSYRKMRDDALSGDPIAKVRYEKTLAMRREAYHAKKSEQTA